MLVFTQYKFGVFSLLMAEKIPRIINYYYKKHSPFKTIHTLDNIAATRAGKSI